MEFFLILANTIVEFNRTDWCSNTYTGTNAIVKALSIFIPRNIRGIPSITNISKQYTTYLFHDRETEFPGPHRHTVRAQPAPQTLSDPPLRPAAHPDLFGFGRHVDLLVPRANAGHGSAAVLPATRIRLRRSGDRAADDRMAGRDHGRGSRGRNARRAHPRRTARRDGADGNGRGTVPAGLPAR